MGSLLKGIFNRGKSKESQLPWESKPPKDGFILVFGDTGAGKSSLINDATGGNLPVGHGLESATKKVTFSEPVDTHNGSKIKLVDIPGFDDAEMTDSDVLDAVNTFLLDHVKSPSQIIGIIFVREITDKRMTRSSLGSYQLLSRRLKWEDAARHIVVVTTKWDKVDKELGELRQRELETIYFKDIKDHGATFVRYKPGNNTKPIITAIVNSHK